MGVFIWHDWARFVSISASVYLVWAAIWGIFWRKFFWDFISPAGVAIIDRNTTIPSGSFLTCTLNCGGIIPGPQDAFFVEVIVTLPLVQIFGMILGIFMVTLEYPAPFLKDTSVHRSIVFRIVLLVFQAFIAVLFYQGTNASLYSLVAAIAYGRAAMKGEKMAEEKAQRGTVGAV